MGRRKKREEGGRERGGGGRKFGDYRGKGEKEKEEVRFGRREGRKEGSFVSSNSQPCQHREKEERARLLILS